MLNVEAVGTITYTCTLTDEDEKKVRKHAKEKNFSLNSAIKELWEWNEIDVYAGNQTESDYMTESVGYSEFNDEPDIDD